VVQRQLETSRGLRALIIYHDGTNLAGVPDYLTQQGCTITYVSAPDEVRDQIAVFSPNLVIVAESSLLDLLDLCSTVRSATVAPLLVLGQREGEADEVLCLEYGADSYLGPESSPRRVRAHVMALLRRVEHTDRIDVDQPLTFGDVRVDVARRRVYRNDRELDLSQKEFALLLYLVEHAGRPVTRQALAEYVWGAGAMGESRSLDVHVHWLREKLEEDASNPQYIRTVRGVGYSFEP
jgi:DNA-binding response OmpR family regulator